MSWFRFLRFIPMRLRSGYFPPLKPTPYEVDGPFIKWGFKKHYSLLGFDISFKIPPASFDWDGKDWYRESCDYTVTRFTSDWFRTEMGPCIGKHNPWRMAIFLKRDWTWCYEGLRGRAADINCYVGLLGVNEHDNKVALSPFERAGKDLSYFSPNVFEMAIIDYLDRRFGYSTIERDEEHFSKRYRFGPLRWRKLDLALNLPCVVFDIDDFDMCPPEDTYPQIVHRICMFPISDDAIFTIDFSMHATPRDHCCYDGMSELANKIIDSLEITLSDEVKNKLKKMHKENPDASLPEEFMPIQWGVTERQDGSQITPKAIS